MLCFVNEKIFQVTPLLATFEFQITAQSDNYKIRGIS